jgi:hypothetical protein
MKLWPHMSAWIKSRHPEGKQRCPLYPQKRTLIDGVKESALCQKRTLHPHLHRGRIVKTTGVRSLIRFLESYG